MIFAYTFEVPVRTNIEIDDSLMDEALKVSGLGTKREVVEAGLRLLVRIKQQQRIRRLRGKLRWEGSLEDMRRDDQT
jgi:Arc/MetJ family transcription regulator